MPSRRLLSVEGYTKNQPKLVQTKMQRTGLRLRTRGLESSGYLGQVSASLCSFNSTSERIVVLSTVGYLPSTHAPFIPTSNFVSVLICLHGLADPGKAWGLIPAVQYMTLPRSLSPLCHMLIPKPEGQRYRRFQLPGPCPDSGVE